LVLLFKQGNDRQNVASRRDGPAGNLRNVPEAERPKQDKPDPDDDPTRQG